MFEGFSQEALDFLNDIRFNNNQAFYAANQARYERFVKRPMRELSDELAPVAAHRPQAGYKAGTHDVADSPGYAVHEG